MPAAPMPTFERERLDALLSTNLLDTPRSETFDNLVNIAAKLMKTPIAAISLLAARRQWFKASHGLEGIRETPRNVAFCGYAILDPKGILTIEDATQDARVSDNPYVLRSPYVRSYAGVPLLVGTGLPIGALCVADTKPRTFSAEELRQLADLARMVSKSLLLYGAVHKLKQHHDAGAA
jgi:GAF domain-containing protein